MKKIHYNGFELEHFDSASNFRKYQVSLILKYINGNFVEVGAGKGGLVPYYKKIPKSVTLLEPEKKLFKILKKKFYSRKIRIKNHTVNKLKSYYDTIIYYDVLEHIKKDLSEVRTASKKLKKNGYLIFNVPAYQSFFSEFDRSVGHYKRYNKKDFINI